MIQLFCRFLFCFAVKVKPTKAASFHSVLAWQHSTQINTQVHPHFTFYTHSFTLLRLKSLRSFDSFHFFQNGQRPSSRSRHWSCRYFSHRHNLFSSVLNFQIHLDRLILHPFVFSMRDLWADCVFGFVWWFWILGLCQNYVFGCVWILICLRLRSDAVMNDDDVLCLCIVISFCVDLFLSDLVLKPGSGLGFLCNCLLRLVLL